MQKVNTTVLCAKLYVKKRKGHDFTKSWILYKANTHKLVSTRPTENRGEKEDTELVQTMIKRDLTSNC